MPHFDHHEPCERCKASCLSRGPPRLLYDSTVSGAFGLGVLQPCVHEAQHYLKPYHPATPNKDQITKAYFRAIQSPELISALFRVVYGWGGRVGLHKLLLCLSNPPRCPVFPKWMGMTVTRKLYIATSSGNQLSAALQDARGVLPCRAEIMKRLWQLVENKASPNGCPGMEILRPPGQGKHNFSTELHDPSWGKSPFCHVLNAVPTHLGSSATAPSEDNNSGQGMQDSQKSTRGMEPKT